jgi:hypothetical protein
MLGVGMPRPHAAAVGAEVAVAGVVGDDQDDVRLLLGERGLGAGQRERERCSGDKGGT